MFCRHKALAVTLRVTHSRIYLELQLCRSNRVVIGGGEVEPDLTGGGRGERDLICGGERDLTGGGEIEPDLTGGGGGERDLTLTPSREPALGLGPDCRKHGEYAYLKMAVSHS